MTEKRFIYNECEDCIEDNIEEEVYWGLDDVLCNLLNELSEENGQLKEKLNEILELTELTGMIHLRKAEIKSIIKGDEE